MKKINLTLILLIAISVLPGGCCMDSCCGESFDDPGKIDITSLEMSFETLSNDDTVKVNEYLSYNNAKFNINVLDFDYISELMNSFSNGFNLAYACSPPEPAPDAFLSYKVVSDQEVSFGDSIIDAGTELSQYFEYNGYQDEERFYLFYYDYNNYFTLSSAPSDSIDQNFEFELEMEDGERFKLLVEDVRILPI